jgi:selenocysteine-specific translation elongation factor
VIIVRTKDDLVSQTDPNDSVDENIAQIYANQCRASHIKTGARYGDGIDDLKSELANIAIEK